ncbi:MAG: type VI secretion system baseplate subunit TssK [Bryobacterales bacterium]|nr:type VI secretion system baseplate subunit TssK [Bryobacterales bacterium]
MTKDSRHVPLPIEWSEGMLLTPQHFQELCSRSEGLQQYLLTISSPFPWGVLRFDYDHNALVTGRLAVLSIEAVMPDGLLVSAGGEGDPLELDLAPYADRILQRPAAIHLAVPSQRAMTARGDLARYRSTAGAPLADANTGEGDVVIPRLSPKLVLLPADGVTARFQSFPLVEVTKRDEALAVTDFIPPGLRVSQDSQLGKLCAGAVGRIRERAIFLAEQMKSRSFRVADIPALEMMNKLERLVNGLPLLEASLYSGCSHPYHLYLALCAIAGPLSVLSPAMVPPLFSRYNHNDLRGTFQPVISFLDEALAQGVAQTWRAIPMAQREGGFEVEMDPMLEAYLYEPLRDVSNPVAAIGLRVPSGAAEAEVLRWAESCHIGSESVIPSLISKRVLGARRRKVETLPDLNPPAGMVLFALATDNSFLKPGEALYLKEGLTDLARPLQATLYVRNRPTEHTSQS